MASKKTRPSRLGRGLSSLMATPVEVETPKQADDSPPAAETTNADAATANAATNAPPATSDPDGLIHLPVDTIQRNRHQPRQRFDGGAIKSLAESIASQGLMQPIVVRPLPEDASRYELIAGERRWRAAQEAGLAKLPALIRAINDEQAAEWALVENLQREDLNPIEKAEAFQRLSDQFALSHTEIARRVGLQRSSISNLLRLLDLSDFVRDMVRENLLSMGQARAIAGLADAGQQRGLAEAAVREGWSVRQVETEVRRLTQPAQAQAGAGSASGGGGGSAALSDLEKQLGQQLGTRVKIKAGRKKGSGTLSIDFYSLDEFDGLLARLDVKTEQ